MSRVPSWLASSTRITPPLAASFISSSFRNLATVSALAKPASSRSTSRLALTDWARATTGLPASARASPISCSSVVFPVPATPRIIITRSREPSTWRTAAFCPSLNQSREHGRSGSPSGRQSPPALAGEVDQPRFQGQHFFRRRHRAAGDITADQRTLVAPRVSRPRR